MAENVYKHVRPQRLKPRCRLSELGRGLLATTSSLNSTLSWGCEIPVQFGRNIFFIRFPSGFHSKRVAQTSGRPCAGVGSSGWPLLVYLHGSDGRALFNYSKKSLLTQGLQFAADSFVVISPECDWKWKESPKPWIYDLIAAFRVADWIDHRRIYLTGYSLGGMGVWEVAAQVPHVFAAIVPVAAYHKPGHEGHIARSLVKMPILPAHGTLDSCCRISDEIPLWTAIEQQGHVGIQCLQFPGKDHDVFVEAYCLTTQLYTWMLRHMLMCEDRETQASV